MTALTLIEEKLDFFPSGTIKQDGTGFFRKFFKRGTHAEFIMLGQRFEHGLIVVAGATVPGQNRAIAQAHARVGDYLFNVEIISCPQTAAVRAGTVRVIEREHPRCDFRVGESAVDTGMFR